MDRGTSLWGCVALLTVVGCSFAADGYGSGTPGIGDSTEGAGDLGSGSGGGSGGDGDSGSSGGADQGSGNPGGSETGHVNDSDGTMLPTDPLLELNGGKAVSFVLTGPGKVQSMVVTLVNKGGGPATNISPVDSNELSFVYPGGFPGQQGTCGGSLGAGEMCLVDLGFAPLSWGNKTTELALTYDGGPPEGAHITVTGQCGGTSEELVQNGGFESGLDGWNPSPSSWTTQVDGLSGEHFAFAGQSNTQDFVLSQNVDVSQWSDLVDQGSIAFLFDGKHRGSGLEDPNFFRLRFLDGSSNQIDEHVGQSNVLLTWANDSVTAPLPIGTRTIEVAAVCTKQNGSNCNGYFEGVSLATRFPAQ